MAGPEPTAVSIRTPTVPGSVWDPDISVSRIIYPCSVWGKIIIKIGRIHAGGIIPVVLFIIAFFFGWRVSSLRIRHIIDT
jgi:hypothetical protein